MSLSTKQPSETPARGPEAVLIFVFAGREARKTYGLELFRRSGPGAILLLSVGRYEIRKLSSLDLPAPLDLLKMAQADSPPLRHYFVCFENEAVQVERIALGRFGTWSEVEALSRWLQARPRFSSLRMVSSASHLPRVRLCCHAFLPQDLQIEYLPSPEYPPPSALPRLQWPWHGGSELLKEWVKFFAYRILLHFPWLNQHSGRE